MTVTAAPAVSAANGVESPQEETETIIRKRTVQPRGMPGIRRGRGPKQTGVPRRKRRAAQVCTMHMVFTSAKENSLLWYRWMGKWMSMPLETIPTAVSRMIPLPIMQDSLR